MSAQDQNVLMGVLKWIVEVDVPAITASVESLKNSYPNLTKEKLAKKIFSRTQWKCAASGFVTGLPANFATMIPTAIGDVALTIRLEVIATAKVAIIYNPEFFNDEDASWELLVPVFGINAVSQIIQDTAIKGGQGLTRSVIKKYLSKETLKQFKKIMLKYFGLKVTQKGIITKTIPIIGGVIGGVWNWIEVHFLRKRVIKYFKD